MGKEPGLPSASAVALAWAWVRALPPLAADVLIAAAVLLVALPGVPRPWDPMPPWSWPSGLALAELALAQAVPHLWRRRWPLGVVAVTLALYELRLFTLAHSPWQALPEAAVSVAVALWAVAAFGDRRTRQLGAAVAVALAAVFAHGAWTVAHQQPILASVAFAVAIPVTAIRSQQRAAGDALAERAERLEATRRQTLAASAEERVRIARELHDVVAHHVSVMVVQAEAAQCVLRSDPAEVDAAVQAVARVGREALVELRRLLGILRTDDGMAPREGEPARVPRPSLRRLGELVGQVRATGLPVELTVEGKPRPLPAGLDLSAYRIVQEALTNALKHAGRATTRVLVRYSDEALELEVANEGPPAPVAASPSTGPANGVAAGDGYGLAGMRERVAVFAGELAAGPRPGGGFAVRVRLPLPPGTV